VTTPLVSAILGPKHRLLNTAYLLKPEYVDVSDHVLVSFLDMQPGIVGRMQLIRVAETLAEAQRMFGDLLRSMCGKPACSGAVGFLLEFWKKAPHFLDCEFEYSKVFGVHTDNHSEALIRTLKNCTDHLRSHSNRRLSDVVRLLATGFSRRYVWDRALLQASRLGVYRGDERSVKRQRLCSARELLEQHSSLPDDSDCHLLGFRNEEEGKYYVQASSIEGVYEVDLNIPRCSCKDHKAGHLCKHILFVAWATTPSLSAAGLSGVGDAPYKQVSFTAPEV
jgi:hypothetical protein